MTRLFAVASLVISPSLGLAQLARVELSGALPPEAGVVEQVVLVIPEQRTVFLNRAGDLLAFDHAARATSRVLAGRVWDVAISAKRDLLLFVKGGEGRTDRHVWVLPMDARTGQPSGAERRLTATQGDAPAISPDGRFVAFARDDTNGVGQSLIVVPIAGGTERVVTASMPSSIRAIVWTPDGKSIYFGVDKPVPCVPEWSCLPLDEAQRKWGSIRRVRADGGEVTVVVSRAQTVHPGLSPDGSALVYQAVNGTRRWIIANPDGTERTSLTLSTSQSVQGWTGGATLVLGDGGFARGLRSLSAIDLSRRP